MAEQSKQRLKLFFWDGEVNFGDELSKIIVEFVSRRTIQPSGPYKAQLFGIGSIFQQVKNGTSNNDPDGVLPWVWGSGFMSPANYEHSDKIRIAAVRGEKTAEILGVSDVPLGDPGLLAAEAFGRKDAPRRRIGIVPHWRTVETLELSAHLGETDEVILIDPRNTPDVVLPQIASCDMILSSSLHGLIVADSYGIANHWIAPRKTHYTPRFKFWDYASSIGRHLGTPIEAEDLKDFLRQPKMKKINYFEGIIKSKHALMSSFPSELKARPNLKKIKEQIA